MTQVELMSKFMKHDPLNKCRKIHVGGHATEALPNEFNAIFDKDNRANAPVA
jgi:hypothetical protein